jgi:hypothetical protein
VNETMVNQNSRSRLAWKTFLLSTLIGPPFGAVLLVAFGGIAWVFYEGIPSSDRWSQGIAGYILFLVYAIPFSYVPGGIYAALTGAGFALYGLRFRQLPFWFAILMGIVTSGISNLVFGILVYFSASDLLRQYPWLMFLGQQFSFVGIFMHAGAAVFCWWIVRRYWIRAATA